MRRRAAILLVTAGCTFDATGLGETPQTGAGPGTQTTVTATTEPMPTATGEPTTETTVGVSGSGSMTDATTGDPTATTETTTTGPITTTVPDTTAPCTMVMAYKDFDNDYYGDPSMPMMVCEGTQGWVPDNTDCNDMSANAHPGLTEVCDTIDNDCDGLFDEYDEAGNSEACLGCTFKVREASLYYFCSGERDWEPAEEFCKSYGLHLAKDDGGNEHDWLLEQIGDSGLWWIGANDRGDEDTFTWVSDGSAVAGDLWGNNEPNDQEWFGWENADCVGLLDSNGELGYPGTGGRWNDHMCDDAFKFICEGPLP